MIKKLSDYYRSFSGTDAVAFLLFPSASPIIIGSLTTLSYSIFREKFPVKVMSRITVPNYTKGLRYCAGTMIFTLINKHWVNEVITQVPYLSYYGKIKADELPPFDIMIVYANEYGSSASMMIYAAEISDEAQTLSIEDIFTENQFSFICKDIDVVDSDGSDKIGFKDVSTSFIQPWETIVTKDLDVLSKSEEKYQKEKDAIKNSTMKVYVDGDLVTFPDIQPFVENGRTIAQLRFIFEKMGWLVRWDNNTKVAQFNWDNDLKKKAFNEYIIKIKDGIIDLEIDRGESTWATEKYTLNLDKAPYIDSSNRYVCEIRPFIELLYDRIYDEQQKYKITWGGNDGKSVFIDSIAIKNKPQLSMESENSSAIVENAQALLNENGIKINVSGVYDYSTKFAVISYQLGRNLPPTGVIDKATWGNLIKKNKIDTTKYPQKGLVNNKAGTGIYKDVSLEENSLIATLKYKQDITITSKESNNFTPIKATHVGVEIKGFVLSKDILATKF